MQFQHQTHSPIISPESDATLLINAGEFARILGVSPRTLWRLLSAGKLIQPIRIGGSTRWRAAEVRRWIEDGCQTPHPES